MKKLLGIAIVVGCISGCGPEADVESGAAGVSEEAVTSDRPGPLPPPVGLCEVDMENRSLTGRCFYLQSNGYFCMLSRIGQSHDCKGAAIIPNNICMIGGPPLPFWVDNGTRCSKGSH